MKAMAAVTFFFPINWIIFSAIAKAPPDFSRNFPMITPSTMIIPILPRVWPNPSLIELAIFSPGIPENIPKNKQAKTNASNGWICILLERTTISKIDMINMMTRYMKYF